MCLLRSTDWIFIYRQFNIQQFYVLPTQYIYVFCVALRTNSDYIPVHHYLIACDYGAVVCVQCIMNSTFINLVHDVCALNF